MVLWCEIVYATISTHPHSSGLWFSEPVNLNRVCGGNSVRMHRPIVPFTLNTLHALFQSVVCLCTSKPSKLGQRTLIPTVYFVINDFVAISLTANTAAYAASKIYSVAINIWLLFLCLMRTVIWKEGVLVNLCVLTCNSVYFHVFCASFFPSVHFIQASQTSFDEYLKCRHFPHSDYCSFKVPPSGLSHRQTLHECSHLDFKMHCGCLQGSLIIYVKQTVSGALKSILQSSLV